MNISWMIIQTTKRSAISALLASGLELGDVSYVDNIGRDMVIELFIQGRSCCSWNYDS